MDDATGVGFEEHLTRVAFEAGRDTALTSLQPSVSEMRWQPIESAPKDGRALLLYDPEHDDSDDGFGHALDGHWADTTGPGVGEWQAAVWCNSCTEWHTKAVNPTHWMPLPNPPALSPEGEP